MMRILFAVLCFILISPQSLRAAEGPVTFEQFRAWFQEEWNRAQLYPPIAGFMVEYSREYHEPAPSISEVQRLRRLVDGRPDHPERQKLAEYERRLKDGHKKETYRIWSEGAGRWRRSADYNYNTDTHPFFDAVIVSHDDRAWTLNRSQLAIYSPANGFPPGRDYTIIEGAFEHTLKYFFTGGLNAISSHDVAEATFVIDGKNIRVRAGPESGSNADLVIYWDGAAGRGFVQEMRFRIAGGDYSERRMVFENWQFDDTLQSWRVEKVTEYNLDETIRYIFQFVNAEFISPEIFDDITTPPTPLQADAVRGEVAYSSFTDYRAPAQPHRISVANKGVDLALVHKQVTAATSSPRAGVLTWLLVALSGIGACAIAVVVWRKFSA